MNLREAHTTLEESYPEWASMQEDEQVKVCHHCCADTGMADHKERLYIKRTGSMWLLKCFNCGEQGYYRSKEPIYSPIADPVGVAEATSSMAGWRKMLDMGKPEITNTEMRLWLAEYEMLEYANRWNIRQFGDRLILPINKLGSYYGVQARMFNSLGPKYVTYKEKDAYFYWVGAEDNRLFMVEDLLSAMKLASAGKSAMALMGTNIPPVMPTYFDELVIWLDDDVAGHTGALKFVREVAPLYRKHQMFINKQPKEIPFSVLQEM